MELSHCASCNLIFRCCEATVCRLEAAFSSASAALYNSVSLRTRDGARDGEVREGGAKLGFALAMRDLL